ncbi:MAG: VOC family protein [Cyclobacteriaceae bacterium]
MKSAPKKPTQKKPAALKHYVNWFEIPALNFERALSFYNAIYSIDMETNQVGGYAMGFFPAKNGIGGAVVTGEGYAPNDQGPLLYLNGGKDLTAVLAKIEDAGGRVIMPKTLINEAVGYFALFIDTEGNRLALHSKS